MLPRSGRRHGQLTTGGLIGAVLAVVLAACSTGSTARPAPAAPAATSTGSSSVPSTTPSPTPSALQASACARRVLSGLSDAERVGQVFVVGLPTDSTASVLGAAAVAARVHAGNYLLYGGTGIGTAGVRALTGQVDDVVTPPAGGVRPFVATDQEGGHVQSLSGPGFDEMPTALVQGTWTADRLRTQAARWGRQLRGAGVTLDFAPVADVVPASLGRSNQPIGRWDRQYGSTPDEVSPDVVAFLGGLQSAGVVATAKHFPGLGRVIGNPDDASGVTDSLTRPDDASLQPFRAAVRAGVGVVMLSSARYPAIDPHERAVFSATTVRLLRDRVGFGGLVASDDLGAARQVADVPVADRARRFLEAGGQLVVVVRPTSVVTPMVTAVLDAVRRDAAFAATVDAAALAVLAAKERAGLLAC